MLFLYGSLVFLLYALYSVVIFRFRKYGADTTEQLSTFNEWILAGTHLSLYTIVKTLIWPGRKNNSWYVEIFPAFFSNSVLMILRPSALSAIMIWSASSNTSSSLMCNVFHIRLHLNFMYYLADMNMLKELNVQNLHTVIIVLWQIYWAMNRHLLK